MKESHVFGTDSLKEEIVFSFLSVNETFIIQLHVYWGNNLGAYSHDKSHVPQYNFSRVLPIAIFSILKI